jgi:hypothetical protein
MISPQLTGALPFSAPRRARFSPSNTGVAGLRRKRIPMKFEMRPAALCARTVAVEMTTLAIYGLLAGIVVSVLLAVPVVLLAAGAS